MSTAKEPLIFFAAWWPSKDDPTAGVFIQEHARSLQAYFDVHVVHLTIEKSAWSLPSIDIETLREKELTVHRVSVQTPVRRFGIHDLLVARAFQKIASKLVSELHPSHYVINVRSHLTKFIPSVPALKGLPFLLIEHFSYYSRVFPTLSKTEQNNIQQEMRAWFNSPLLKRILVVSKHLGKALEERFDAPANKIGLISNVVPDIFEYVAHESSGKTVKLLAVAKWEEPKRPDLLFDALEMISVHDRPIELHIYGDGTLIERLKERRASMPANTEIELHGLSSKDDIARSMQRADLLVHPSDAENAPTVIAEALCCGLPVVSMSIDGIPEMIQKDEGILIPPRDATALARAIEEAIARIDSFDRKEIARRAKDRYSETAVGERLYKEIKHLSHGDEN